MRRISHFNCVYKENCLVSVAFDALVSQNNFGLEFNNLKRPFYSALNYRLVFQPPILQLACHLKIFEQRIVNYLQIKAKPLFREFILIIPTLTRPQIPTHSILFGIPSTLANL